MTPIKHFSFDLWLTLIKSNPVYKRERSRYFFERLNPRKLGFEEVDAVIRKVDLLSNAVNEKTGFQIRAEEMIAMIAYEMDDSSFFLQEVDVDATLLFLEELILNNMPVLCDLEIPALLEAIKSKEDTTLSILSNTGFVKGKVLRTILSELSIFNQFDFLVFSDEVMLSKPNQRIFEVVWSNIESTRKELTKINKNSVLHVGDNKKADFEGARNFGFKSALVDKNSTPITDILKSYA